MAHTKSEIRARNTEEDLEVVDLNQLILISADLQDRYNFSLLFIVFIAVREKTCKSVYMLSFLLVLVVVIDSISNQ